MKLRNKNTGEVIDVCLAEWEDWEEASEIDEHKDLIPALQDVFNQLQYGGEAMLSKMADAVESGNVYQVIVKAIDLHDKVRTFCITINEIIKEK